MLKQKTIQYCGLQISSFQQIELPSCYICEGDCLYREEGVPFSLQAPLHIDFFIPHNWANDDDPLNYLDISLYLTNLVLRHPSSMKKKPNEVSLPLNRMKVGWNTIWLRKEGNDVLISAYPDNTEQLTVIQTVNLHPIFPYISGTFHVSGLLSFVNCPWDNVTSPRFFLVKTNSVLKVPLVFFTEVEVFIAYADSEEFSFEVTRSGKRQQICMFVKSSKTSFTIRDECEGLSFSSFPQNTKIDFLMYSDIFDPKDVLMHLNYIFPEIFLRNTGDNDFFIQIIITFRSNVSISILKDKNSIFHYRDTSSVDPLLNDSERTTSDNDKDNLSLVIILTSIVVGVIGILVLCLIYFIYGRKTSANNLTVGEKEFFPFREGYVYAVEPQGGQNTLQVKPKMPAVTFQREGEEIVVVENSYFVPEHSDFAPNLPEKKESKTEGTDENYYEEYHYYERYHPEEVKENE